MHEATIAKSILETVSLRFKQAANVLCVLQVRIHVGEFRNIDGESLRFAFDNLKELYDGCCQCQLEIQTIPVYACCRGHGHKYHPEAVSGYRCCKCGEGIGKIVCGKELDIVNITLEAISSQEQMDYA